MLRQIWRLHRVFFRGIFKELKFGILENRKGLLISMAMALLGLVVVMTVVLKVTASPEFCGSCHNMQSYIDSWRSSSHRDATCMDCHFEPGFVGSLLGKWKAQAHIVMKITGTAPTRPHTQISDASCLREGCHSTPELVAKKTVFKGVNFQHDTHLNELRRGRKLRCVTCHSQIVQGEHLAITQSACFTCHFFGGDVENEMADCQLCHVKTKDKIYIDANENMPFVHQEYLDRDVECGQCHFDVIKGDGHLKDNICVQCHSEPDIIKATRDSIKMHRDHVTDHKVECYRCHAVIDHGIQRASEASETPEKFDDLLGFATSLGSFTDKQLDTNCDKCHSYDQHKSIRFMYIGVGAKEVIDMPSPMYAAHADCGSCHIPLQVATDGTSDTFRMDFNDIIKSCSDCHGEGYDVMAKNWKAVLLGEIKKAETALITARQQVKSSGADTEKVAAAKRLIDVAQINLNFVLRGKGLHNIDYAIQILADCRERAEKAIREVNTSYVIKDIESPNGCAQLCHSCVECVEDGAPIPFGTVNFPHDVHIEDEGLDCEECHTPRSEHGQTVLKNCNECHHGSGLGSVSCVDCHSENSNLYIGIGAWDEFGNVVSGESNEMAGYVTCEECHVQIVDEETHTIDGVKETCVECHDESYVSMVDECIAEAETLNIAEMTELLRSTQQTVLHMIRAGQYTYDAQDLLNYADRNLKLVTKGNPHHNIPFSRDLLSRVKDLVLKAQDSMKVNSTIKTIEKKEVE
jgi:nitrate/TMAO reductase-like tetraheme cytochrome c subunit